MVVLLTPFVDLTAFTFPGHNLTSLDSTETEKSAQGGQMADTMSPRHHHHHTRQLDASSAVVSMLQPEEGHASTGVLDSIRKLLAATSARETYEGHMEEEDMFNDRNSNHRVRQSNSFMRATFSRGIFSSAIVSVLTLMAQQKHPHLLSPVYRPANTMNILDTNIDRRSNMIERNGGLRDGLTNMWPKHDRNSWLNHPLLKPFTWKDRRDHPVKVRQPGVSKTPDLSTIPTLPHVDHQDIGKVPVASPRHGDKDKDNQKEKEKEKGNVSTFRPIRSSGGAPGAEKALHSSGEMVSLSNKQSDPREKVDKWLKQKGKSQDNLQDKSQDESYSDSMLKDSQVLKPKGAEANKINMKNTEQNSQKPSLLDEESKDRKQMHKLKLERPSEKPAQFQGEGNTVASTDDSDDVFGDDDEKREIMRDHVASVILGLLIMSFVVAAGMFASCQENLTDFSELTTRLIYQLV
jgi:hypothetical protein